MNALFSGLDFFATGIGVMLTCAIAAAIILFWEWRFSLIGLVAVQFGVTAVALHTERIDPNVMIIQTCVIALCMLILALSNAQAPQSPTIRQSGNWLMRLLTLILLYTALRLFDFNYTLPLPGVDSGDALRMTIFFAWLGICALLILSFSDNPFFTGIALLLWCIPIHVLAALLTPLSGIVILIGIIELLLALACSYLVLTEGFSAESRPAVASDITFPTEDRLLLTDGQMRPISEMATRDMPAVPKIAQGRAAVTRSNLPITNRPITNPPTTNRPVMTERSTVLAAPRQPLEQKKSSPPQSSPPQSSPNESRQPKPNQSRADYPQPNYPQPNYPQPNYPQPEQSQSPQQRTASETRSTKSDLRAVTNYSSESASPTRPIPKSNQSAGHETIPNQLKTDEQDQPTQPTLNIPSLSLKTPDPHVPDRHVPESHVSESHVKSKRPAISLPSNKPQTDADENSPESWFFKRKRKASPNSMPDTPTLKPRDSKEEK